MGRWKQRPEGSNWGDFGPNDRLGKMNLLTPERRRAAAAEVREGIAFCLSLPLDLPASDGRGPRKPPKLNSPAWYHTPMDALGGCCTELVCDDEVLLTLQYSTQWDAFAHYGRLFDADGDGTAEKVYYNGYTEADFRDPGDKAGPAALTLGIENFAATGAQGRGVLVDLARYGTERRWVGYDEFMRAIDEQKVEVRAGDFLLINTGYDEAILKVGYDGDPKGFYSAGAVLDGSDAKLRQWIADSDVVALCSDNQAVEGYDMRPERGEHDARLPLHDLCLFKLGVHLGEMWRLGELAAWLRANDRSAFLLTAPPLRLPGAVGSPVTPVATV